MLPVKIAQISSFSRKHQTNIKQLAVFKLVLILYFVLSSRAFTGCATHMCCPATSKKASINCSPYKIEILMSVQEPDTKESLMR